MLYFERWKVALIVATLALGALYALPNVLPAGVRGALSGVLPANTINLGLDLQGGAYLLYEVDLAKVRAERLGQAARDARLKVLLEGQIPSDGYRLEGDSVVIVIVNPADVERAEQILREQVSERLGDNPADRTLQVVRETDTTLRLEVTDAFIDDIQRRTIRDAIEVIRRRIDSVGVSEPIIQRQGTDRVLVQAPGVRDPQALKDRIGTTAKMTFQLVTSDDRDTMERLAEGALRRDPRAIGEAMAPALVGVAGDAFAADVAEAEREAAVADALAQALNAQASALASVLVPLGGLPRDEADARRIADPAVAAVLREGLTRAEGPAAAALAESIDAVVEALRDNLAAVAAAAPSTNDLVVSAFVATERVSEPFMIVARETPLTGEDLARASQAFDPDNGQPVVSFTFRPGAADDFCALTSANVNDRFATLLDNVVITAPTIRGPICGGQGVIEGGFTVESATDLAALLNAGALPAPLTIVEERTVGAELGAASVAAGRLALVLGFAGVIAFMAYAYRLFGLFANAALLANVVLIVGALSGLQATLTLPGIAGIILTIGMAVDANVLIFERIREETLAGRTPANALEAGYRRALGTILDANITTLVAAVVLYLFGSGPVRGFAVTLAIGIVTSVFTAFVLSRYLVALWFSATRPKTLPV